MFYVETILLMCYFCRWCCLLCVLMCDVWCVKCSTYFTYVLLLMLVMFAMCACVWWAKFVAYVTHFLCLWKPCFAKICQMTILLFLFNWFHYAKQHGMFKLFLWRKNTCGTWFSSRCGTSGPCCYSIGAFYVCILSVFLDLFLIYLFDDMLISNLPIWKFKFEFKSNHILLWSFFGKTNLNQISTLSADQIFCPLEKIPTEKFYLKRLSSIIEDNEQVLKILSVRVLFESIVCVACTSC